jgi:lipopolysaccharide export system permease protein
VHQSEFFDRLCGVIGMMAAIFTVTWMQRNNEQLAMLAAGISTHRAIVPVLISSVLVSLFAVANQEIVMPYFGEELSRRHDDDGMQRVNLVATRYDARNIMLLGKSADRATRTITKFDVTIPPSVLGKFCVIDGKQARYIPPDHPTAPLKGGWLIREARVDPPLDDETLRNGGGILTRLDDDEGFPPALPAEVRTDKPDGPDNDPAPEPSGLLTPHSEIAYLASIAALPIPGDLGLWRIRVLLDRRRDFSRGTYFLKTSLTFQAMIRRSNWYQFATTADLLQSLTDPTLEGTQGLEVGVFLHGRLLRPVLSMALLFMSLPLVLGGYGRNMFINLGFALGNSALFYGTLLFTQYLGAFEILSPPLTAWAPLMGFGMIATVRWGQIRT